MTVLYQKKLTKIRFVGSKTNFDLSDKKRENCLRKVEDHQLQALLDEDDTQFFWRGIH